MKNLICICCPKGCHLTVDEKNDYKVSGNSCPRGAEYGRNEIVNPVRTVTHTAKVNSHTHPRLSCKTDKAVPKKLMFDIIGEINKLVITPPVKTGQILIENVCKTDANVIATQSI